MSLMIDDVIGVVFIVVIRCDAAGTAAVVAVDIASEGACRASSAVFFSQLYCFFLPYNFFP